TAVITDQTPAQPGHSASTSAGSPTVNGPAQTAVAGSHRSQRARRLPTAPQLLERRVAFPGLRYRQS
ncbi:Hypothetical predicted protein, partial [Pelobates cultripes]